MTSKRRGVSPVIATLLLIVIAVAAAVLTYVWVTGYIGRTTSTAETGQLQERIKINAVTVTSSDITISVANIGNVNVTLAGAYILFQNGTVVNGCRSSLTINLQPGGITDNVQIPSACTLTKGLTYVAKVVTAKGTEATYTFTRE